MHWTVMLSVIMKCHYPILVSLLLPPYPCYVFLSLLCKSLQTSYLVILTEKFGLRWVPNFKKIILALSSQARTVNVCLSPAKHH